MKSKQPPLSVAMSAGSGRVQPITEVCRHTPAELSHYTPPPNSTCWGVAYRIDPTKAEAVLAHLDYREKGGYERLQIELDIRGHKQSGLTYFATPGNPDYLGASALHEIVEQIKRAAGPSGTNIEYVLRLEEALTTMGVVDQHVSDIAGSLREHLS